jgi:cytochrome P450
MHRIRRGSINRFLSKERVRQLEPILQRNFHKLLRRIGEYRMSKTAVDLNLPFGAYTCDIIMEYSFGEANSSYWLDKPGYYSKFFEMMRSVHMMVPLAKQLPWLMPLMEWIPENWLEKSDEGMRLFIQFKKVTQPHFQGFRIADRD